MATLLELLGGPAKRQAVIDDSLRVLDAEVADKGGFSGIAIKTAYKVVKGVSPDFLRSTVNYLLDDFLKALDPIYQEAVSTGANPRVLLTQNPSRVADALLAITDSRAHNAKNQMVKSTYAKLREGAKKHVESAVPRLGEMFAKHVS